MNWNSFCSECCCTENCGLG